MLRGRLHVYESAYYYVCDFMHELYASQIGVQFFFRHRLLTHFRKINIVNLIVEQLWHQIVRRIVLQFLFKIAFKRRMRFRLQFRKQNSACKLSSNFLPETLFLNSICSPVMFDTADPGLKIRDDLSATILISMSDTVDPLTNPELHIPSSL
jgi:hypothetical protein